MLIRATDGSYVNTDNMFAMYISNGRDGTAGIHAQSTNDRVDRQIALLSSRADAQLYLDKLMKALGEKIIDVNMADWHYEGHRKTHKEIRGGGS